jgi:hypothetical protein
MDVMHDTWEKPTRGTCAVFTPADPWARLKKALGVRTNREVADRAGLSLRTVERLFDNPERSLMRNALQLRAVSGLSLDELFPATEASRSELSEAA